MFCETLRKLPLTWFSGWMLLYFYCIHWWVWNVVWISILTHFWLTLCEKCRCSEFFWSVFSRIRTECGEVPLISLLYSVRMWENTDQKNPNAGNFPAVQCSHFVSSKDTKTIFFFGVFRGYKMETMTRNGLMIYKVSNTNNTNIFRNKMTSIFQEVNKNISQVSR